MMKKAALLIAFSISLVACESAPDDAASASNALESTPSTAEGGRCLSSELWFDPALFTDLKKTVAAHFVTAEAVRIPGSLTAHVYPEAYPVPRTVVNTAL